MKLAVAALLCIATANADTGTALIGCRNGELTIKTPIPVRQITIQYADVLRICSILA